MPDLSNQGSHQFWSKYPDKSIYRVLAFLEGVEDWTLDGDPELEKALAELGVVLDDVGKIDLQNEDKFVQISAYIKSCRTLRLLQCLDTAYPGAASKVLMYAENTTTSPNDVCGLFLRRNIVFERLRLLSRVFAADRLSTVLKALGEEHV